MLPRYPFVVLDMNACRDILLVAPLLDDFRRRGIGVMLPAVSQWELTKGSATTVPQSFELIAQQPDAVSIARHTYRFKGLERTHRRRLRLRSIVDHRQTSNTRSLMWGLRNDTHEADPQTIAVIRDHWRRLLDDEEEPTILRGLVGVYEITCPQARANRIRDALRAEPINRTPFNEFLAEALGGRVHLARFLHGVGYGSSLAKRLARFPSFSLIHYVALSATALRWRVFGGAAGARDAKDSKLENAMLDAEYATLASYGRGFVTKDNGARDVYEAVLHVADRVWPLWHLGRRWEACRP